MSDASAKQEIVEKIKESSNILVTVSRNPSVDELSAALGLTVMLNKMKKHATAVFSGAIPPAITFLDPQKTFEATVDSLRDFIIALDKEKADHLRYKVDGDVVKIFITPYRTTITSDDLEFSQGDYNVELVIGLGVKDQNDLDEALAAHGRILHDATVVTLSVGEEESELGSTDWHEQNASSLSEMLVLLSDSLKSDKPLLDEQIATAYLTGIVAATDRFSNGLTSSKAMTIAGELMTAGANQQLIASKLEEAHEIGAGSSAASTNGNSDGTTDLAEGESTKLSREKPAKKKETKKQKDEGNDGSLNISHEKEGDVDAVAAATKEEEQLAAKDRAEEELAKQAAKVPAQRQSEAALAAEKNLAQQLSKVAPAAAATPSLADLQKDIANASADVSDAATQPPAAPAAVSELPPAQPEPSFGGTLNATTEQAAEDKRRELANSQNHTILTHGGNSYVGDSTPIFQSPLNAASQPEYEPAVNDPFSTPVSTPPPAAVPAPAPIPAPVATPTPEPEPAISYAPPIQPPNETLADLDAKTRGSHDEARAAIDAAFDAAPPAPVSAPTPLDTPQEAPALPPLPPMPDFSTLPPLPSAPAPAAPGDIAPIQPSGALPPEKLEEVLGAAPAAPVPAPQSDDPGQFRIPGQS